MVLCSSLWVVLVALCCMCLSVVWVVSDGVSVYCGH